MLLVGASLLAAGVPQAQAPASFEEFRQGILNDYQEFRHTILEHYADFLEGTWHEYEPLEPLKRSEVPKPAKVPDVTLSKPSTTPVTLPAPVLAEIPGLEGRKDPSLESQLGDKGKPGQNAPVTRPTLPERPGEIESPFAPPKAEIPPEAKREIPLTLDVRPDVGAPILGTIPEMPKPIALPEEPEVADVPEEKPEEKPAEVPAETPGEAPAEVPVTVPVVPVEPVVEQPVSAPEEDSKEGKEVVKFYGMDVLVPKVDFAISQSLEKVSDFARHWKKLEEQDAAVKVQEAVLPVAQKMGLNDYLTFEFLCAYMDSKFPDAGISPRMSAVHYMIANMGFNARIAVATKTGDPIILIPADQTLYAVTYMNLGGEKFYVLGGRNVNLAGSTLATCDLPKGASSGKKFNMLINGLNVPKKERKFEVKHAGLQLTGTVNENIMPIVYRYPQMDTRDYAISNLDKPLRDDLVRQVKEQLAGQDNLKATNELLQFVQSGFDYATDDEFHGFEKPYFLEENLYYPKNDCEDRAIFYTYLLWNALGVENQLLAFPGHESASVSIPEVDVKGTSYTYEGKRFFISDPTYIGAKTGMCMRQFETTSPKIDHTYSIGN